MPKEKSISTPSGETGQAKEIGFRSLNEDWNSYLLDDGTVVRIKLVAKTIYKSDELRDDDGDPVYVVESQNVMVVSASEN